MWNRRREMARNHLVYVIAEAGVNHNGSVEMAKRLILEAAKGGADAVKFQTFQSELLVSDKAPKAEYQKENTDAAESQLDMLRKLELSQKAYPELISLCKELNIDFLSTPFESKSLHFLVNQCKVPLIKISSGEVTNAPFLLEIAHTQKPVILSTGMCTLGDIEMALSVLAFGYLYSEEPSSYRDFAKIYSSAQGQNVLKQKVKLLHCTTSYPAIYESVNLRAMDTIQQAFGLPTGYSDHTEGIAIPLAAVARGAQIIEKHFTLDRNLPGPDHKASLEPDMLAAMVAGIRQIEMSLGSSKKIASVVEQQNMIASRKSILANQVVRKGETLEKEKLAVKRPGDGISPLFYWDILNTIAVRDYKKDEKVSW